jgi:predicted metal-dependent enzyme (double-stranded beta helix superfamily)
MSQLFESFTREVQEILRADRGPAGREQLRQLLEQVLLSPEIAELVGDDQPQRRVLFADPELGFSVLGHVYHEAKRTQPHDHGPGWAIYGQVTGESLMDEWAIVEQAASDKPGKVRLTETLHLIPGQTFLYNERALHAPRREAPAKLIRIEGGGVAGFKRLQWEAV